jgi:hypothetical protein
MLNIAVNSLKYIVELRGWTGLASPLIHARDSTIIIKDPGPYIIVSPIGRLPVLCPNALLGCKLGKSLCSDAAT